MNLLVLNCGSATIKFRLFEIEQEQPVELFTGSKEVSGNYEAAVQMILDELPAVPNAVAHRVVHGGDLFSAPVLIDDSVLVSLAELSDLAPLHNPPSIKGIKAAAKLNVPQVAVFDTAFHQTMPEHAYTYALPVDLAKKHRIRRYGFHGSSHQYVTELYAAMTGNASPTIVTLHLGNGASAAAIKDGSCIDTTMGMTPCEGLVMGTRPGDIDPAIPIVLQKAGMSLDEVEDILWHQSGLLGLSGEMDMRKILGRADPKARLAIKVFCYRIQKTIGAYMAACGGIQAIIFTGGIGENSPKIRQQILEPLSGIGIEFDAYRNDNGMARITEENSRIHAYVIATNEELFIARSAVGCLQKG
jgi:acetate kinase